MTDSTTLYFIDNGPARGEGMRLFEQWARALRLGLSPDAEPQAVALELPPDAGPQAYREAVSRVADEENAVGALVGWQRRALLEATRDQFEDLTTEASLSGELSCIYKEEGQLVGHSTRPDAAGQALVQLLGPGYWLRHGAELLCLGAGGAALPLLTYFASHAPAGDRPQRLVLTSQDIEELHVVEQLLQRLSVAGVSVQLFHTSPTGNDQLLAELPDHSVVVNATAAGANGQSPLTPAARFPQYGAAWDMTNVDNGPFLQLARAQANERTLRLQDAAPFNKLAWTTGVGYVLGVEVGGW